MQVLPGITCYRLTMSINNINIKRVLKFERVEHRRKKIYLLLDEKIYKSIRDEKIIFF